jgi:Na+/proline symporter/signal transduction histidine kinase
VPITGTDLPAVSDLARILAAVTAYLAVLFGLASWAQRRKGLARRFGRTPLVYALSLSTFCTTWTYYGSVGFATSTGLLFLAFCLGPTFGAALWGHVLRKMVRIKNAQRITSVVDLLSLRYGCSQTLGAIATVAVVVAVLPYIALQLKTMIATTALFTEHDPSAMNVGAHVGPPLVLLMIVFTILFGIRRLSPTERHPGMVATVAIEGIVKLAGALAVGAFVTFGLFHGVGDVFRSAAEANVLHGVLGQKGDLSSWIAISLQSAVAALFLPRQFHLAVVECSDEEHVRTSMWVFPLYLLAINLFVLPVALGGLVLGLPASRADTFVLALPLASGARLLSWLVFLGGFSAGMAMVVCETMVLATMVSNHLLLPAFSALRPLAVLRRHLLPVRWSVAAVVVIAAYGYERDLGSLDSLVSIGLVSHAGILVLAPSLLAGLYWKRASKAGALGAVVAGFLAWTYTLVVPLVCRAGWLPARLLVDGPAGIAMLRPEAFLGIAGLDRIPHAVLWILLSSAAAFVAGSVFFPAPAAEQARAERLVEALGPTARWILEADTRGPLADTEAKRERVVALFSQYQPADCAARLADECLEKVGAAHAKGLSALQLAALQAEVETTLAATIGAAAAHAAASREGVASPDESRAISNAYARLLARLNVPPAELHRVIDYHREREHLLTREANAQRFLAQAGTVLSESLEYEETLRRLGSLCVQSLADWCVIDVVEKGEIARIAGAVADPAKNAILERLRERYPPRWSSPHPATRCIRSGEPLLLADISDEVLRTYCDDDWHTELVRKLGTRSCLVLPLVARATMLGALTMCSRDPGRYTCADLELSREVAHRAAIAIDNARLYREVQRAVRIRDDFLVVTSHELRTPVTTLSLSLSMLDRAACSNDGMVTRTWAKRASQQCKRLNRLITDLLDVSQVEGGRLELDRTTVYLDDLVRHVLQRVEPERAAAGCPVSLQSTPVVGQWDRRRIESVVAGLLSNALKFGVGKPVEISVFGTEESATLVMRDHGIGIDPAEHARIFDRFERAVSTRHYGGLGLGLYMSRCIVEAHGGAIRIASVAGGGATFTVELPRLAAAESIVARPAPSA